MVSLSLNGGDMTRVRTQQVIQTEPCGDRDYKMEGR